MSKIMICLVAFFLFVFGTEIAVAATIDSSENYTSAVFEVERLLTQGASNLAAGTVPFAEKILAYIALFLVLRLGFVSLLSTFEGAPILGYMFKGLIETSLVVGLLLFFIQNYGLVTGAFSSFFSQFESALGVQGKEGLGKILQTLWESIVRLYDSTIMVNPITGSAAFDSLIAAVQAFWAPVEASDSFLGGLLSLLLIAISKLIIVAFLCVMAFSITVQYVVTQFSVAIGTAIGPVFIAFYALPATRFVFTGWLKYLIKAYFVKVVLFLTLTLAGEAMFLANEQINTALSKSEFVNMFMSLIAAVTIAYVLSKVVGEATTIAREILDGAGPSSANKSAASALSSSSIASTANNMASNVSSTARTTGKAAAATGQAATFGARAMARGVGKTGEAYRAARASTGQAAVGASMLGAKGTMGAIAQSAKSSMASAINTGGGAGKSAAGRMARSAAHTARAAMATPLNKPLPKIDPNKKG